MECWVYEGNIRRRGVLENCKQCGKEFAKRKNSKKKLCSTECKHNAQKNRKQVECSTCGKIIERTINQIEKSKHKQFFCSQDCHNKAQKIDSDIDIVLPKHYGTGNGSYFYKRLCKDELKRGCSCGEKKTFLLSVHHKDGDRTNNKKSNLEIVCGNCHIIRHLKKKGEYWVFDTKALTPRNQIRKITGM